MNLTTFRFCHFTMASMLFLAVSGTSATEFVRPRPLIEYEDIMLAQELDNALGGLDARLASCADAGPESADTCRCRYPKETEATKAAYEKVMAVRPKWKGKILFWKNPDTQASRNLVMPAIDSQLSSISACGAGSTQ
jgi:hypothetical protein